MATPAHAIRRLRAWFGWFNAMCVYGLVVLAPLTAAFAQEPAEAAADSSEGAATTEATVTADSRVAAAVEGTGPTEAIETSAEARAQERTESAEAESEEDEEPERTEPNLSLSLQLGVGYMSGGHGGLFSNNRSPLAIDAQVLTVKEPRYLLGGALRIELEGAHAVAAIVRFQLRHPLGPIELRPGIGLPFYIAPRTMIGPEAGLWGRLTLSKDLAMLLAFSAAAFVMGDDVPKGNTVIMLQIFVGAELFI